MKHRLKTTILLILQSVALLLMFMPNMYTWELVELSETSRGMGYVVDRYACSFISGLEVLQTFGILCFFIGVFVMVIMLGNIVFFILDLIKHKQSNALILATILAECIFFAAFIIIADNGDWGNSRYAFWLELNVVFYIQISILLVLLTFAVFVFYGEKKSKKASEAEKNTANISDFVSISNSVPDEIKKYKELLDAGAITQEEYDIKKKQLLNI